MRKKADGDLLASCASFRPFGGFIDLENENASGCACGLPSAYGDWLFARYYLASVIVLMTVLQKQCSKCKQVLPGGMFSKDKTRHDGLRYACKKCDNKRIQSYSRQNPIMRITVHMVGNARTRAKEKELPFDLSLDFIRSMVGENARLASHCPLLGIPLDWSNYRDNGGKALPNSPSLDRIDSTKGYTKDNVWVISYRANTIKHNASHEELALITRNLGRAIVNNLDF